MCSDECGTKQFILAYTHGSYNRLIFLAYWQKYAKRWMHSTNIYIANILHVGSIYIFMPTLTINTVFTT